MLPPFRAMQHWGGGSFAWKRASVARYCVAISHEKLEAVREVIASPAHEARRASRCLIPPTYGISDGISVIWNRRGVGPFLAVVGALMWSLGFAVWAYVGVAGTECTGGATGETCRSTPLVQGIGRELLAVLAPAIASLVVWVLLHRYCTRGEPLARGTAVALAALFAIFCLLAAASLGLLLLPIALLLVFAVAATAPPPTAGPATSASD